MSRAPKPLVVENAIIPHGLDLQFELRVEFKSDRDRGCMTLHFRGEQFGPRPARGAVEEFAAELMKRPPAECPWPKYESCRDSLWNLHARLILAGRNAAGAPYPDRGEPL